MTLLIDSYQHAYGNIYTVATDIVQPRYASNIDLLPTNDLRNWSPTSPVMMCGGSGDLNFINAELMEEYWVSTRAAGRTSVLNLDSPPLSPADPYASLKAGFAAGKAAIAATAVAQGATDGGTLAVLESYHIQLEEPYCFSAARLFFEQHRDSLHGIR